MLPIATTLFHWRITHLVTTLSEQNKNFNSKELQDLMMNYGEEAKIVVISSLLDEIDFKTYRPTDAVKLSNLKDEIILSLSKPNAATLICRGFEGGKRLSILQQGGKLPDDYLENVIAILNLSVNQAVMLAFCIVQSQFNLLGQLGLRVMQIRLNSLTDLSDFPDDMLQGMRLFCTGNRDLSPPEVSGKFLSLLYASKRRGAGFGLPGSPFGSVDLDSVQSVSSTSSQRMSIASVLSDYGCQISQSVVSFRNAFEDLISKIKFNEEQLGKIIVTVTQPASIDNNQIYSLLQGGDADESKLKSMTIWNLDVIAEVLAGECKSFDWNLVVRHLDQPNLKVRSESDFIVILKFVIRISGKPFPAAGLMGVWDNKSIQLFMLLIGANLPRNVIDFSTLCLQENKLEGDVPLPPNLSWVSLHMYKTLIDLATRGLSREVLEALVSAAGMFPEYVTVGLAQVQDPTSGVRADILRRTLPLFTALPGSRPTSIAVMKKLLEVNQDLLVILCRISLKRATTMQHILEADARLKSIGAVGRRVEDEGVLDELIGYWCVLSDRGELNLEEKLNVQLAKNPLQARFLIAFAKMHAETLRSRSVDGGLLSYESCAAILRVAQQHPSVVPVDEIRGLAAFLNQYMHNQQQQQQQILQQQQLQQQQAIQAQPQLMSDTGLPTEQGRLHGGNESLEVEDEANAYFQKIYTSDISIPEVVQLLKRFKASADNREQEIFRCMIHNLFDEYRFFHKYPDKELQVTGRLFGALIQHQLVSSITLGIALRYVLEALRKDPEQAGSNEKMFRFGKIALDQFRPRLGEWPQYCSHLVQIPHLSLHCPEVFQEAQRAIASPLPQQMQQMPQPPQPQPLQQLAPMQARGLGPPAMMGLSMQPDSSGGMRTMESLAAKMQSAMNMGQPQPQPLQPLQPQSVPQPVAVLAAATPVEPEQPNLSESGRPSEIDRMVAVNQEVAHTNLPPENVRDQIHFIVNNIAKANVEEKSLELKSILSSDYFSWFANYLVVKRISTQPNLHPLYAVVLDMIESNPLLKTIMVSVYHNVTKLLQSPKITSSSSERSLLRNLGSWLGQMTLARNKPLLHRRINVKELVLWGYETGRLIAVCSFVAKILEGARDSKVFRPPNPWLMALLGVMRELYELEDLKINIKFEVQVLCKNINIKIEDIPRGNVLSTRRAPIKNQFNQDFTYKGPPVGPDGSPKGALVQEVSPPPPPAAVQQALSPARMHAMPLMGTVSQQQQQVASGMTSHAMMMELKAQDQAVMSNLAAYVNINPSLQYFNGYPAHRKLVAIAVDRAIREVIQPVIERSVTIACVTTKQLVMKDYAVEPNEKSMLAAAQLMVSNLASSLSLVTCREPLRLSISNHLRALFSQFISDQPVLDQLVATCASDNVELGCILIEKAATEKAVRDIEEILTPELQTRRRLREAGQPLPEPVSASAKPQRFPKELPDSLKPRPSGLLPHQQSVYESFQKPRSPLPSLSPVSALSTGNLPVLSPLPQQQQQLQQMPPTMSAAGTATALSMGHALEEYEHSLIRVDNALKAVARQVPGREVTLVMLGGEHEILVQLREMMAITQKIQPAIRVETAVTYAESVFKRFAENLNSADLLRLEVVVGILEALREACGGAKKFAPDIISWLGNYASINAASDEAGKKVHRAVLSLLLKAKLLRSSDVDIYFATFMDGGRNMAWVEIALDFIRQCLTEGLAAIFEFPKTFDTVSKMRQSNVTVKKQLQKWLTDLKVLAAAKEEQKTLPLQQQQQQQPATPSRDPTVREHVMVLIDRWLRIWTSANEALFGNYLQMMHQYGVLKTEEAADRFFRISTELCVEACLKTSQGGENGTTPTLNFTVVDALAKLFLLLVRLADKEAGDNSVRVSLLARILNAIAKTLLEDHESKKSGGGGGVFDQRPYYRLFSFLAQDLGIPDPKQEPSVAAIPLLTTYSQIYLALQPSVVPGFAFGWLQLISQRCFMPQLLLLKGQKGWPIMHRLLIAMLLFLQPFLKHAQLTEAIRKLYKSTLRVLLVILHDFPEFLSDYHLSFCDVIPSTCVQLRNLVLSAFPRSMRLPDPFTPNLKVDLLPEINQTPRILSDYAGILSERGLRQHIDSFLATRQPADLPVSLANILAQTSGNYSLPLITALVVYIGSQAIVQQQQSKSSLQTSLAMDIFKALTTVLDAEGRYHVISAMVNQLRFPNSQTHYFSCVLLVLFAESENEVLQEQITRVLLERLIVHRPHPWGLLITFIELIKNSRYGFWQRSFTRCAPEIEKVFESVAKSCVPGPVTSQQQQVLAGGDRLPFGRA